MRNLQYIKAREKFPEEMYDIMCGLVEKAMLNEDREIRQKMRQIIREDICSDKSELSGLYEHEGGLFMDIFKTTHVIFYMCDMPRYRKEYGEDVPITEIYEFDNMVGETSKIVGFLN